MSNQRVWSNGWIYLQLPDSFEAWFEPEYMVDQYEWYKGQWRSTQYEPGGTSIPIEFSEIPQGATLAYIVQHHGKTYYTHRVNDGQDIDPRKYISGNERDLDARSSAMVDSPMALATESPQCPIPIIISQHEDNPTGHQFDDLDDRTLQTNVLASQMPLDRAVPTTDIHQNPGPVSALEKVSSLKPQARERHPRYIIPTKDWLLPWRYLCDRKPWSDANGPKNVAIGWRFTRTPDADMDLWIAVLFIFCAKGVAEIADHIKARHTLRNKEQQFVNVSSRIRECIRYRLEDFKLKGSPYSRTAHELVHHLRLSDRAEWDGKDLRSDDNGLLNAKTKEALAIVLDTVPSPAIVDPRRLEEFKVKKWDAWTYSYGYGYL